MTRIVLVATGGTISSRGDAGHGARAVDTGEALIASLGILTEDIEIEVMDVLIKNSFNFSLADLAVIRQAVDEALVRADVDGVVVTYGTDTMEETAALLALCHDDPRPVVITGAQRGPDHSDADGPRNLRDAVRTAASPNSRERGVMIVFGGEIHAAIGLTKRHTLAAQPFVNVLGGPIGFSAPEPVFALQPERRVVLARPTAEFASRRIEIVHCYPGADGSMLRAAVNAGAHGIVVLGSGSGNPGAAMVDAITEATAAGVVMALGTRTGQGAVEALYGGGGAVDAIAAGAVPLGQLPAHQARVLLALMLDARGPEHARRALEEWLRPPTPARTPR